MDDSILNSIKKNLGLDPDYKAFDPDITLFINGVFGTLTQLGVGPAAGFMIEDESTTWDAFISDDLQLLSQTKNYIYLRVRLLFDPPATSFLTASHEKQIEQLEWRLNARREEVTWVPPTPSSPTTE